MYQLSACENWFYVAYKFLFSKIYILRIAPGSLQLCYNFISITKWRNDDNKLPGIQSKKAGGLWPQKKKKKKKKKEERKEKKTNTNRGE